jgi:fatty acid desaturase
MAVEPSEDGAGRGGPGPGPGWLLPITIPVHPLTRYLRVRLEVTDGILRWEVPRTLLGVIPIGTHHVGVPMTEVRSARVRMALHPFRLLAGAACIVLPLVFGLGWFSAPLVVVGAWVVLVSFGPHVKVVTGGGARHRAGVCYGHRIDGELYATAVNDLAGQAATG